MQNKERYSRHLNLKGFGLAAQQKLQQARVLVIGAGGLGCPVLQYLAAAGVGTIGIADEDVVSLSNLQRQVLYTVDDLGLLKAKQATERLRRLNPEILIHAHIQKVDVTNAMELIGMYDMVVDGTDNFASRYLINDACLLLGKPLVFAAVYQYEGQLAVFNVRDSQGSKTSYRDLFPTPPKASEAPDCNAAGVLGVLPGIMGIMQAMEVIKLVTGIAEPLTNQLLTYNALSAESYTIQITPNPQAVAHTPKTAEEFSHMDYEWLCSADTRPVPLIDASTFEQFKIRSLGAYARRPGVWRMAAGQFPASSNTIKHASRQVPAT